MNLQAFQRGVQSGQLGPDYAEPVEISLREVDRLDAVVRGVLSLGKGRSRQEEVFTVSDVLESAIQACGGELERRGVRVELHPGTSNDTVRGIPGSWRGRW